MQRMWKRPIFVLLKKHNCPRCSAQLERIIISKTVNSDSIEAQHFDFNVADISQRGDVLFTWDEFRCPKCGKHFSVDKLFKIEKEKKKRVKQEKRMLRDRNDER